MQDLTWIKEIEIISEFYHNQSQDKINQLLKKGWKLLSISQQGNI